MKIRKLLKKNEIYFNILSSLLLGSMAVIVSYSSYIIAKEQKLINYYENTPDFYLSQEKERDSTGNSKEVAIRIAKYGGKAKNISLRIESYVHFEIIDKKNKKLNTYVHLTGFFNESYRTGENKGDIRLLKGINNSQKFDEFVNLITTELIKNECIPILVEPLFIVKINYTDFLNKEQEEYYDVSLFDGVLIDENDSKIKLFENKHLSSESIPISKIETNKINDYLKIILNESDI